MFKRLSSTMSARKSTKTVVNAEAPPPVKAEEQPLEEKEPVSESRGEDAPRDKSSGTDMVGGAMLEYALQGREGDAIDQFFGTVERIVCAPGEDGLAPPATEECEITKPVSESHREEASRDKTSGIDTVGGAMLEYALQGQEGDAIDHVFGTVERMVCAPGDADLAPPAPKKCQITKFSQDEKIGISLRTSITTDGLYVSKITPGSKFEATALELGQKVLNINGVDCPTKLLEAIGMLKGAESTLVLEVGPNDEAAKKIDEMGEMSNDLVIKKDQLTEIAVDGYADSCGFFWSLQNGLYAFGNTGVKAIEAKTEEQVEEAPKEEEGKPTVKASEAKAEEHVEETRKEEEAATSKEAVVETPKEEELAKPEEDKVEGNPKSKKRMSFKKPSLPSVKAPTLKAPSIKAVKKPSLPSVKAPTLKAPSIKSVKMKSPSIKVPTVKAPSMPSFRLSKKNKKVEEETKKPATETIRGEDGMVTIKLTKDSKDESVGLALRNSVSNDNIYVYGIFEGSKLKKSGFCQDMRIHSINGEEYTDVEKAVKFIKETLTLEFVAGPNDETEIVEDTEDTPTEQKEEETVEEKEVSSWFW